MKTTTLILLFAAMFCQAGCSQGVQQQAKPQKTDWEKENLKGKVKKIKYTDYECTDMSKILSTRENESAEKDYNTSNTILYVDGYKMNVSVANMKTTIFNEDGYIIYKKENDEIYENKYEKGIIMEEKYYDESTIIKRIYINGTLDKEYWYDSDSILDKKILYKSNEQNDITEVTSYDSNNNLLSKKINTYIYDKNRNKIEGISTEDKDKINNVQKIVFVYDKNSNLIEQTRYNYNYQENKYVISDYTKYNTNGTIIEIKYYTNGIEKRKEAYTYNEKNYEINKKIYNEGILIDETNKYKVLYDTNGNLLKVEATVNDYSNLGQRKNSYILIGEFKYDNNNCIEINNYINCDGNNQQTKKVFYTYDKFGNCIESKDYELVNDKIQLTSITTTEYEYYE